MVYKKLIIIGVSLFLIQNITVAQQDTSHYFEQGILYFKQQKYNDALTQFNKAIEQNPNNSKAYNNRGIVKRAQNNTNDAIADFSKAIELNPKNIPAYKNRGLAYMNSNQYWEAFNDFNTVLYHTPNDAVVLKNYLLVKNILKIENTPKEPILLKDPISVQKDTIKAIATIAPVKDKEEKKKASSVENESTKTTPSDKITPPINPVSTVSAPNSKPQRQPQSVTRKPAKTTYKGKEVKYTASESSTEKIKDIYTKSNVEDPLKKEELKTKASDIKNAYIHYSNLIAKDSNNAHAYLYRGKLKSDLHNYKTGLNLDGDSKNYTEKLADAGITRELSSGEFGAIEDYTKAITINPQFFEAYYFRGLSLYNIKQFNNAIADFSKAIELNPTMSEAYYYRGITKGILNDMSGACVDLIKASEMGYSEADEIAKECK